MGMFGGGGNDDSSAQDALNAQIAQQQAQLEEKRQNLFQQRIQIIKSSAGPQWMPNDKSKSTPTQPGAAPALINAITQSAFPGAK